jgi:hypothetical protein
MFLTIDTQYKQFYTMTDFFLLSVKVNRIQSKYFS